MREETKKKFWLRVNKNGPVHPTLGTACWLWQGSFFLSRTGPRYGQCFVSRLDGGKHQGEPAHRVAWKIANGDPGKLQVLHRCDNPPCCRPGHLFLGTNQDNVDDKVKKQRHAHGETDGNSRFTEQQVLQMRKLHAQGHSLGALAMKFNTYRRTVSLIVQGLAWAHVGGPVRAAYKKSPPRFKLSEEVRAAIVAHYDTGEVTMQELADANGVSLAGIHLILKRG